MNPIHALLRRARPILWRALGAPPAAASHPPDPPASDEQLKLLERYATETFWRGLDAHYEQSLKTRTLTCLICGHSATRDGYVVHTSECMFGGGRLERYECPACGCIFGAQKFLDQPESLISLDYQLLYSRYAEGNTTTNEERTFFSLNPGGGAYVNWGCGLWNDTVPRLRNAGHDVWGFEPAASHSTNYVVTTLAELPTPITGLFSNNVIEHFRQPVSQFEEFARLLAPGARMAHSSPCYEYLYPFTRFHTVFLLGKSPEILAQRSGFKVVDRIREGEYINVVFERL